jgi:hypothetical protein
MCYESRILEQGENIDMTSDHLQAHKTPPISCVDISKKEKEKENT